MRELKLHDELYTRHSNFVKSLVGNEFNTVIHWKTLLQKKSLKIISNPFEFKFAPNVFGVLVCGEIVSAKNFDYDDLHVYYQLDLPRSKFK